MLSTPRTATIGLLLCLTVIAPAFAGCGGGSGVSDAFGGLSDNDMAQMQRTTRQFTAVMAANVEIVRAFTAEDIAAAQGALDDFTDALDEASTGMVRIENEDLQQSLDRYVVAFEDLADAYQRSIDYFSDEQGVPDLALEDRLLSEISGAGRKVRRADRAFLREVGRVLNDEQRETFEKAVRSELDRQQDALDQAMGQ